MADGLLNQIALDMATESMPDLLRMSHVTTWDIEDFDTGQTSAIACAFEDMSSDGCGVRTVVSIPIAKVRQRAATTA